MMLFMKNEKVKLILIWLVGAGLSLFSNGANSIPIAAWLAPVFLLRFTRKQKSRTALFVVYLTIMATFAFQFRGMVPLPPVFYLLFLLGFCFVLTLPYIIDRLLINKLHRLLGTLIFPVTYVAIEYLISFGPYGTWGAIAYSQYGNLQLLQLLSVTGMWGITFLIGWFASTCNLVWDKGFTIPEVKKLSAIYAVILIGVLMLGGVRVAVFPPASQTVRVAGIVSEHTEAQNQVLDGIFASIFTDTVTDEQIAQLRDLMQEENEAMFIKTMREAEAGARIVSWAEINAAVLKEDEAALIDRGREVALEHGIYLALPVFSWIFDADNNSLAAENKIVMITPEGQVEWEYHKAIPVPGWDAAIQVPSEDGQLKSIDTPYGRIVGVLCFDANFPRLLAQAGRLNADIVINPSNDWLAINPWHTRMASFRGIEQGFNQVRVASNGTSAVYDYHGNRLSLMNYAQTEDGSMVAYVPVNGVRTVYAMLGDWFAWICLAGLLALIVCGVIKKKSR